MLGRLLVEELNPDLLSILKQPSVLEAFDGMDYLRQEWDAETHEQAAVDYCALFVLPKGVSPMAGAWLGGGEREPTGVHIQTVVSSIRARVGFPLPKSLAAAPPEHAGLLLFLGGQLACATDSELSQEAIPFLKATLCPWFHRFSEALANSTVSPLYSKVGQLLDDTYDEYLC